MRRRRSSSSAYNALVRPSPRSFSPLPFFYSPPVLINDLEDRRMFHPSGKQAPAASLMRGARRLLVKPLGASFFYPSARVGFAVPKQVAICVRRKQRKEVLHAIKFGGGGGASVSRRRRRNSFSEVDC